MFKTICIFLFLFSTLLQADIFSIVDTYRTEGIGATEKSLDKYLATTEYWDKKISKDIVRYGWYENPIYLLILNTDKKNIDVYHYEKLKMKHLLSMDIVLGSRGVGKKTEGDKRTPIGIYKIVKKKVRLPKMYGPLAFVTNYPNKIDRTFSRDGSGIWIHGFPPNEPDKSFTKGCIATPNKNLIKLDKTINYRNALVVISAGVALESNHKEISKVLAFVYRWRYAWKYNLFSDYLSLYSKDLVSSNGDFSHFKEHKKKIFLKNQKKTIRFTNFKISKYPNTQNLSVWQVSMSEYYKTRNYLFKGEKIIYLLKTKSGLKIWREL
jgi:murein L,D-transpeptidase YafK